MPQVLASRADWRLWGKAIAYVAQSNTFSSMLKEQGEEATGGSIGPRVMAAAPEARAPMLQSFIAENMGAVCSINVDGIDFDTPLTSLGLDSLMAVELMNRIEGEIGLSVPMGKVLAGPSIRELADIMLDMMIGSGNGEESEGGQATAAAAALKPLEHTQHKAVMGLSANQQRWWTAHQNDPTSVANMVVFATLVLPGLDAEFVAAAVREVTSAHPMLRTTFQVTANVAQPCQRWNAEIECEFHDLTQRCNQ